jgi:hypothetical protein
MTSFLFLCFVRVIIVQGYSSVATSKLDFGSDVHAGSFDVIFVSKCMYLKKFPLAGDRDRAGLPKRENKGAHFPISSELLFNFASCGISEIESLVSLLLIQYLYMVPLNQLSCGVSSVFFYSLIMSI